MAEDLSEVSTKILDSSDAQTAYQSEMIYELKMIRTNASGNVLAEQEIKAEKTARDELMIQTMENVLGELETISENTEENEIDAASGSFGGFGLLLTGLGIAIGVVIGTILGAVKGISTIIKAFTPKWITAQWSKLTNFFKVNLGTLKTNFIGKLKSALDFVSGKFKGISDIVSKWGKKFPKIGGVLKTLSQPFVALKNMITGSSKAVSSVTNIAKKGKSMFTGLKSFGLGIGNVARVVSKIAAPLTIIMAAFDAVTGAMEGWETGGVLGAIGGAIKGLVNSIIMKPLDLLKDGVSWILEKMGFADASKALDSFSFEDMFTELIDSLVSSLQNVWDTFSDGMSNIGHTLMEGFKEIVRAILPDPDGYPGKMLPSAIYEWAEASPPSDSGIANNVEYSQGETVSDQLTKQQKRRDLFAAMDNKDGEEKHSRFRPRNINKHLEERVARKAKETDALNMVQKDSGGTPEVVKEQKELTENESEVKMQGGQDRGVVVAPTNNNVNNVSNVTHNSVPPKARPEWNSDLRRSWA